MHAFWSDWNEEQWNHALFFHYFGPNDDDLPVARLRVTPEELAIAIGADRGEIGEVEKAFVAVLHTTPHRIRARFSGDFFGFSSQYDQPPRAVIHLLFTCYVASASEEMRNEADFRRRLAIILSHPSGTSYQLEGLGKMWRQFQHWLARARATGQPWRELVLPDPRRMVRIGFSLRLAFPQRRDQLLLDRILAIEGIGPEPTLLEIVNALRPHRFSFSETFRDAYEEFRQSLNDGSLDSDRSPLLDAVRDAIVHANTGGDAYAQKPNLCLVGERDDRGQMRLLLLSDRPPRTLLDQRLRSFEPDRAFAPFCHAITFGSADFDGGDTVVEFLLGGELPVHWVECGNNPLCRVVADGVLLFHRSAFGTLECALNLNIEDEVWPLVRRQLAEEFSDAVRRAGSRNFTPADSAYDDWIEFPSVAAEQLRAIDWSRSPSLKSVRCLQPGAFEGRIGVVGGMPTGEPLTWLGHRIVLPHIRVRGGAESVRVDDKNGRVIAKGETVGGNAELFSLRPIGTESEWDGEHIALVRTNDGRALRKQVCFRAFVDGFDYLTPSKPNRWLCESSFSDLAPWNSEMPFAGAQSRTAVLLAKRDYAHGDHVNEHGARLAALTEICAARCNRRRDFSEAEWIELFEKLFGAPNRVLARIVLRAWVEAGLFDHAIDQAWRTQRLFARKPRLAISRDVSGERARVIGLVPSMLVSLLRQGVQTAGGTLEQRPSASPWVVGAWEIRGLDLPELQILTRNLSLADVVYVPAPDDLHASLATLQHQLLERPLNYERHRVWSWKDLRFVEPSEAEDSAVHVEWWQRPQRLDRPDVFEVRAGDDVFCTYSRNWALLAAAKAAGMKPWNHKDGSLQSVGYPWVFLPTSVGRFCFAGGTSAAGPICLENGSWSYVYPLGTVRAAATVLEKLGFASRRGRSTEPHWLESLATVRIGSEPCVPVGIGASRRLVPASLRPLFIAHGRPD
jgi:hypothetical protein